MSNYTSYSWLYQFSNVIYNFCSVKIIKIIYTIFNIIFNCIRNVINFYINLFRI